MSAWSGPVAAWLVEVYVLATVVLVVAWAAARLARQPARRLMVARWALATLVLLVPLTAAARALRVGADGPATAAVAPSALATSPVEAFVCPCPEAAPVVATTEGPGDAVLAAFVAGSGATIGWLGLGALATVRLTRRSRPAPERLRAILDRVVGGRGRAPRLVVGGGVAYPAAVGLVGPTIVLPSWFAEEEPEARIEAALAHEWAHIRNGDLWLLAAARLLLPLLFAHPLYLLLRREVRADQEALADAAAAAREGRVAYAEALLRWSRAGGRPGRSLSPTPILGLGGRRSSLARRVALLLDGDFRVEPSCPRRWRLAVRAGFLALLAGLGLASIRGSAAGTLAPSPAGAPAGRSHAHVHATSGISVLEMQWNVPDVCCAK